MKILDIIPVNFDIITDEMKEYLESPLHRVGLNPTTVEHDRIHDGKPSIESAYDETINAEFVYKIVDYKETNNPGEISGCFVNCFGDPGVTASRCRADFPVFGGFEPAVLIAMSLADKIGIITVLDNVQPILHEHVNNTHFDKRIVSIRNVNMPVLGLEDHTLLIERLTEQALLAITVEHAEAFVLGCTGMLEVAQAVEANLARAGYTAPVIEPGQAAMVMSEMLGNLGYNHSRKTFPKI